MDGEIGYSAQERIVVRALDVKAPEGNTHGWTRALDCDFIVGDEPSDGLVNGLERAVARRIAQKALGFGNGVRGAAEDVFPGGLRVLGGLFCLPGLVAFVTQPRLLSEPAEHRRGIALEVDRLRRGRVEGLPDALRAVGDRAHDDLRDVVDMISFTLDSTQQLV